MKFEGSVAAGPGGYCIIKKGKVTKVGNPADWPTIQGKLCKVWGKGVFTDGIYSSLRARIVKLQGQVQDGTAENFCAILSRYPFQGKTLATPLLFENHLSI
jgi:hypothetical protein